MSKTAEGLEEGVVGTRGRLELFFIVSETEEHYAGRYKNDEVKATLPKMDVVTESEVRAGNRTVASAKLDLIGEKLRPGTPDAAFFKLYRVLHDI